LTRKGIQFVLMNLSLLMQTGMGTLVRKPAETIVMMYPHMGPIFIQAQHLVAVLM
jgi:hypothetical protein